MWISLSWLRDYVDLGAETPERIAEDLTMKTALIEAVERRGEFGDGVVIGRVLERTRHPNADRLNLCVVDVGDAEPLQIVCGAPNVDVQQTVAVARVGAVLPGDFKIKKSKIRGVESHGMICSEVELRLGEDHDGIMVLDEVLEVGSPFEQVRGVADVLLEIDNKSVTHRPDLWGHEGFARELATIYGLEFRPAPTDGSLRSGSGPVDVRIEAPDLCGRYHALFARGPFGAAAPGWMRRRLSHCGLRPISLAVDLSNYVMLDIGQPTHPFDARTLRGDAIRVRRAAAGETIVTLDGDERKLPPDACVIADAERAVAVAGIVGGSETGIAADTVDLVLESAWFEPIAVRRTATALGIRTDALTRFEKHLDPDLSERAVRRFATLLREHVPTAEISPEFVAVGETRQEPRSVTLRPARCRAKLGVDLSTDEMATILSNLGFGAERAGDDLSVVVPSFRAARDVDSEDDLIEEVGRIHGYSRIEPSLPAVSCQPVELEPVTRAWRRVGQALRDRLGFAEVLSYPFVDEDVLSRADMADDGPTMVLKNPLQATARGLRRSLVPYLLEFVDRNVKTVETVRLFECGRVFLPNEDAAALPHEPLHLGAAWGERTTRPDGAGGVLRRLRGALDEVFDTVGRTFECRRFDGASRPEWAHPGRAAEVLVASSPVGVLAQVHPRIAHRFGWKGEVALLELDLSAIVAAAPAERKYVPLARHPAATADLSFVAPFDVAYGAVVDALLAKSKRLTAVELVDEFTGAGLEPGTRSLTLGLTFRATDRTMTDKEVAAELTKARAGIEAMGGRLRS